MSRGVNKVILIGHLGNDPETRYMPSGGAVTNITLATSDSWKDKQTNELRERTEWHRVTFYNRLAEIVNEYCKKGSKIYIEGALRTRKWTDKDNIERYTTEIIAAQMEMLDSKRDNMGAAPYNAPSSTPSNAPTQAPRAATQQATATEPQANDTMVFDDDDVPF